MENKELEDEISNAKDKIYHDMVDLRESVSNFRKKYGESRPMSILFTDVEKLLAWYIYSVFDE